MFKMNTFNIIRRTVTNSRAIDSEKMSYAVYVISLGKYLTLCVMCAKLQ